MDSKECNVCKINKPFSDFHKRTKAKDGLQSICKPCNRKQRNEYYQTAAGKKSNSLSGRKQRQRIRYMLYQYLLANPCECGESDPAALDFDHDDPNQKEFALSSPRALSASWSRIEKEIAKCTVRCANCHRKKTAKDNDWYNWFIE